MIPYLVVYVTLSTTGLLLLRSRLGSGDPLSFLATDPLFLLGALCYATSFLTWLAAIRRFELTTAFPIFISATYAAVMIGAVVFLGEHLTGARLVGVVLVGFGIILVGR